MDEKPQHRRLVNAEIGVDTEHLGDIIQSAYMQTVFDVTKGADYRAAFDLIPESRVKAILSTNWSGQMFSERVWDNTNALADGLKHDMLVGIMAGKSEQHMADDIMNRCGVGAFEARRLVRTETTCVANMAELYGYKELDIDKYEFSACLDSRTSDLCRELDGKVFKRNSAQAGVNLPPMHPFCRSTTLPVLPSEEDLDKELAELGDEIGADVDFDEWERNLQQGEDGKWRYVAGSVGKANADKPMRFAGDGVDKSKENGIINIEFDEFVPCLKDAETGEIFQTEVRELTKSEYSRFKEADGWNIDWSDIPDGEQVLGVYLKNDTEPQGLIAIRKDKGGVYLSYASTAPINNKLLNNGKQKFIGVGGHLFAAAIEESVKAGNETGCIYGYAANQEVLNHYIENFGAVHLPITHEYQFIIDGEAAEQILSKYNFERI